MNSSDPNRKTEKKSRDLGTGDLFAWGAKQREIEESDSISHRETNGSASLYGIERSNDPPRAKPTSVNSYLYGGNGGRLEPAGRDATVVRNRVVFLVLLLGLVVFVALHIARG